VYDSILTNASENISPRVYAVTYTGSRFIAAGQWGRTAWSTDGLDWTFSQIGSFNYLDNPGYFEDVLTIAYGAYGGGILVAAGGNGKAAYSEDNGENWKWAANMLLGNRVTVNCVCFANNTFIAAGTGGNMKIVSPDQIAPAENSENGGDNWKGVNSKFDQTHIYSVAYNGSRFIAVGDNGKMSESPNGTEWTQILPGSGTDQNKFGGQERISCIFGLAGSGFIAGGFAYSNNASKITYSD
jgi:hypothetical protein